LVFAALKVAVPQAVLGFAAPRGRKKGKSMTKIIKMNEKYDLMKLLRDLGEAGKEMTASEIKDEAEKIGLHVESSTNRYYAKEMDLPVKLTKNSGIRIAHSDLLAKINSLRDELKDVKEAIAKLESAFRALVDDLGGPPRL